MAKVKMVINAAHQKSKINKEIYGHFSEHLGRCIYEGIYVGEDSKIPNTRGIRNDVVEGDQNTGSSLARRLFCRRVPLEGSDRAERKP